MASRLREGAHGQENEAGNNGQALPDTGNVLVGVIMPWPVVCSVVLGEVKQPYIYIYIHVYI